LNVSLAPAASRNRGPRVDLGTAPYSRVTVAVDGMRITGEWVPKTTISGSARAFPLGEREDALLR
jgi:hypothetical protein